MALARMVCGNCGAMVSVNDRHCSQCGEQVEFGGSPVACNVCGHTNTNPGAFCESCGARMPGAATTQPGKTPATKKDKDHRVQSGILKHRFEPWQIGAGVVMLILLGYFGYSELNRTYPPAVVQQTPIPVQQQSSVPVAEIQRLEQVLDSNPNDAGAALQLANRLHDAGLTEPRYLSRAVEVYQKYLTLNPSDPNARVDLGICYFEIGKMDSAASPGYFRQAVQQMETAFRAHPDHQPAAFNLGIVSLFMGNMKASSEWFTKAAELNPESDLGKRAKNLLTQHSFQQPSN